MKAILFDLDGTLLPMDQDKFVKVYFKALANKLIPHGIDPKTFTDAMWQGIGAMLNNDGKETNEIVFWRAFDRVFGRSMQEYMPLFDEFYLNEFDALKASCGTNENTSKLIKTLKTKGYRLVLATNPVFPIEAYRKRTAWNGIDISDFELVTSYENSHFCKPRNGYYAEILEKIGCDAKDCIMVGNDVGDDMPAAEIGINVFLLLSEYVINKTDRPIEDFPHGDIDALIKYIESLDR